MLISLNYTLKTNDFMHKIFTILFIIFSTIHNKTTAQLFQDDFGTAFTNINSSNWPCNGGSSFNTGFGECTSTSDRAHYIDDNEILASRSIFVPATGYCLSFDYAFNAASNLPSVQIGTGGFSCSSFGMTWTTLATLAQAATCTSVSYNLDAYAGQNIYIRFVAGNSFTDVMLDDVLIDNSGCSSGGGGGSGADLKWADNFNDGDLTLNYAGNDGDESCSACGNWLLSPTASLEISSLGTNTNQTEAFPDGMSNVRYVRLDRNEYIESPVIDLSGQEALKINFYAKSSSLGTGGGDSWSGFSDRLKLQIWDGSNWTTVKQITEGTSVLENKIDAAGFNYFCFTAYHSASSPGNYYYNSGVQVNPAYFHSTFQFRLIFEDGFSGAPQAWVDDISFRADNDGYSTVVPCGVSYWNEPAATGYGRDPEATASNHAERGVNLELDGSISFPPNWTSEADDGDQVSQVFGSGEAERIVFCVISEQRIQFSFPRVHFFAPDIGNRSSTMSLDNNYTGPGFRYYAVEYISCDLASSSISSPTDQFRYHYVFEYGNEFIPVFYHLNSSGIESGGGVTTSFEQLDAPDVLSSDDCGILPIDWMYFNVQLTDYNTVGLEWKMATDDPLVGFDIERSYDAVHFEKIGWEAYNNALQHSYYYEDSPNRTVQSEVMYYRLKQLDDSGNSRYSAIKAVALSSVSVSASVFPNPVDNIMILDVASEFPAQQYSVHIVHQLGQSMVQYTNIQLPLQIDTQHWPEGVYTVQICMQNSSTAWIAKFIK